MSEIENITLKKIGRRIQKLRTEQNLSQQDLAAKINYEKSNMSRLEAGKTNMTVSTLEKIANALEVELIELFRFKK